MADKLDPQVKSEIEACQTACAALVERLTHIEPRTQSIDDAASKLGAASRLLSRVPQEAEDMAAYHDREAARHKAKGDALAEKNHTDQAAIARTLSLK
jgi:chromosome segregation ATPase